MARRIIAAAAVLALAGSALLGSRSGAAPLSTCGLPDTAPVWVDYGEGSLTQDVRAVFARPGIVVATSGVIVPGTFRDGGAATVEFVRTLPALVGEPSDPADPAAVAKVSSTLLKRAQRESGCATPWIVLNELLGSDAVAPWTPTTAQYRANVRTLVEDLAAGGARPVLLVHGAPNVDGDAADWWRAVARAGGIAYEAYYDAPRITAMGPVAGNRRMRLGMRNFVAQFEGIGIPAEQLGLVLGFHSALLPGSGGRQGLQPREQWLRFVKWNALAARQVAADEQLFTVISWGWGTFGPGSVDEDKAAAACVYLWSRDPALCDGPAVAGPEFEQSKTEGQIVLQPGRSCVFEGGPIRTADVDALARFTKDRQAALDALFARTLLARVRVPERDVLARERLVIARSFGGKRAAYERALAKKGATPTVARAILRDDLRRRAYAASLRASASAQTPLEALADRATAVLAGATCGRDELPGWGWFPARDDRDLVVPALARQLPFLLADRTPPATPSGLTATAVGGVTLTWQPVAAVDLAGYAVYRAASPAGPWTPISKLPPVRPYFLDPKAPAGSVWVVRALDTSGNVSPPSAPAPDPRAAART